MILAENQSFLAHIINFLSVVTIYSKDISLDFLIWTYKWFIKDNVSILY